MMALWSPTTRSSTNCRHRVFTGLALGLSHEHRHDGVLRSDHRSGADSSLDHSRQWAGVTIALCVVLLPCVPFGTALGIYGLWKVD
jgi:hypothetical protein